MKLKHVLTTLLISSGIAGYAEETDLLKASLETRFDIDNVSYNGKISGSNSGFKGKYLLLRANGELAKGVTYNWRQRLNRGSSDENYYNSTDMLYLTYSTGKYEFSAGKQVVAIGGYEYDKSPIDLYGTSLFWQNIPCFEIGASVASNITSTDKLLFQVCQSSFWTNNQRDLYGYNLMWLGSHGMWNTLYSINMTEVARGYKIGYVSLGNKFSFDKCSLELDLMSRTGEHPFKFEKDITLVGELSLHPCRNVNVFGKVSYDLNKSDESFDPLVLTGTDMTTLGAGVEYFPLKKDSKSLRLHLCGFYSMGENANRANFTQDKTLYVTAGITWKMNFFNIHN